MRLAELAGGLRERGVRVGTGELIAAQRALAAVDPASRPEARLALRAALCAGRGDLAAFDLAFALWAGERSPPRDAPLIDPVATAVLPRVAIPVPSRPALAPDEEVEVRPAAWSDVELLRDKDFADYTEAERAQARAIMARIARRGPRRRSRRTRPSRRRSHRPDPRATPARLAAPRGRAVRAPLARARASGSGRWCWSATSPGRWSPTRGCCSSTRRPASPRDGAARRSPSAPG